MLTIELLLEKSGDERELMRAWLIAAAGGVTVTRVSDKVTTLLVSSDKKERYEVSLSLSEAFCDCVAFARSRERGFCKHVGALALAAMADLPPLHACAPAFTRQVQELTLDDAKALLAMAAAQHSDVYDRVLRRK